MLTGAIGNIGIDLSYIDEYICKDKRFMKKRLFFILLCSICLCGCFRPWFSFDSRKPPAEPDYSQEDEWAALPWKHDAADTVPKGSGQVDNQANAKVDVFYIYPTLDFSTSEWNADTHNKRLNNRIEHTAVRAQASAFNGSCRVFAPRYRQAILASFMVKEGDGKKALELAYSDVRRAFLYYMQHYNNGRPVIIAGHSQGTLHAYHLVREFFDTTALKQKLVAAYLVGFKIEKDSMKNLKPCDSAKATGCYVSWNTVAWGGFTNLMGHNFQGVCVNPLSWKQDSVYMDKAYNMGSVNYNFSKIDKNKVGAACRKGSLWISIPSSFGYSPLGGSYHIFDYNFFYMNIRANVADRVNAYLKADSLRK